MTLVKLNRRPSLIGVFGPHPFTLGHYEGSFPPPGSVDCPYGDTRYNGFAKSELASWMEMITSVDILPESVCIIWLATICTYKFWQGLWWYEMILPNVANSAYYEFKFGKYLEFEEMLDR